MEFIFAFVPTCVNVYNTWKIMKERERERKSDGGGGYLWTAPIYDGVLV